MGHATAKLENLIASSHGGQVVRLNADARPRSIHRPDAEASIVAVSQLPAILEIVSRAATVSGQRKDRASIMEERALAAEERLSQMGNHLAEVEARMQTALEDAERERLRAEDLGRRSAELIKKTQGILNDANDRRLAAEWRADQAEESFATLRAAVEKGFSDAI